MACQSDHWSHDAVFYHIYPLGACGAPRKNDPNTTMTPRLDALIPWVDYLADLGVNAVYLGPLFESSSHGYDTADYFRVDRRLGDNGTLARLVKRFHARGIRVILDAVLNHTGRDFWAFRELRKDPHGSPYRGWFAGFNPAGRTPFNDPFSYDTWHGYYELVKLNLADGGVRAHLLEAVRSWIDTFNIDGLRLDAADCMDCGFLRELASFSKKLRPDFWLLGEAVHADNYRKLIVEGGLDSATDYEVYKGLYSSHNDANYFEIGYSLDRLFGGHGLYRGAPLYNFADNHDVDRVASTVKDGAHLYPLYALLFTMPGVPSLYYGSEWGVEGKKNNGSDDALRPFLSLDLLRRTGNGALARAVASFARVRRDLEPLRRGSYRQLALDHEQIAFARQTGSGTVIVAVNAAQRPAPLRFRLPSPGHRLVDVLNNGETFPVSGGAAELTVPSSWARIMTLA